MEHKMDPAPGRGNRCSPLSGATAVVHVAPSRQTAPARGDKTYATTTAISSSTKRNGIVTLSRSKIAGSDSRG